MTNDVETFKGLAYIVAERNDAKWANNVIVIVKRPRGLRLDAIERITDVVATLVARDGGGVLNLPIEGKKIPLEGNLVKLPGVGEVPMTTDMLADILVGRPKIESGGATVSESFHADKGSYFVRGLLDEMEMSSVLKMPLAYTRYSDSGKKTILFEATFDDFAKIGGKQFPRHIVVRFERPKMLMEIKYKDMQPEASVPWGMIRF